MYFYKMSLSFKARQYKARNLSTHNQKKWEFCLHLGAETILVFICFEEKKCTSNCFRRRETRKCNSNTSQWT